MRQILKSNKNYNFQESFAYYKHVPLYKECPPNVCFRVHLAQPSTVLCKGYKTAFWDIT